MSTMPVGTQKVTYRFSITGSNVWLETQFIADGLNENVYDALETAANAVVTHLQTAYPGETIKASRTHYGDIEGDPWPTP